MARQRGKCALAGTITPVYSREGPLPIQGICATCRAGTARACWRKNDGSIPTLQNIFLEGHPSSGPVQEGIGQFVATRQVTRHPVAVSRWDKWYSEVDDR